ATALAECPDSNCPAAIGRKMWLVSEAVSTSAVIAALLRSRSVSNNPFSVQTIVRDTPGMSQNRAAAIGQDNLRFSTRPASTDCRPLKAIRLRDPAMGSKEFAEMARFDPTGSVS